MEINDSSFKKLSNQMVLVISTQWLFSQLGLNKELTS